MKQMVRWTAAALLAGLSGTAAAGGNITASVGVRSMDQDYWAPVDSQAMTGALADFSFSTTVPLHLALGWQVSGAEETESGLNFDASVVELSAGVKVMPQRGLVRPFVGAGFVSTSVEFESSTGFTNSPDSDSSRGYYLETGMMFRFAGHVDAGFNLRVIVGTDIDLSGASGDADALVVSGIVGFGWDD